MTITDADRDAAALICGRGCLNKPVAEIIAHAREQAVQEAVAALAEANARIAELEGQIAGAVVLIDELNKRKSSRDFYGIKQTLHAKLATIRAQLARAALKATANA